MSEAEKAAFRRKLDDLSERLRVRTERFRKKGQFSVTHEALLNEIGQRHDRLRKKVVQPEHEGSTWDLMKAELARDFSSIFDDFLQLEERLDAESMKRNSSE